VGHVVGLREIRNAYRILMGKHEEKRGHLGNLSIDGRIILR
jgi:hypothetical protein